MATTARLKVLHWTVALSLTITIALNLLAAITGDRLQDGFGFALRVLAPLILACGLLIELIIGIRGLVRKRSA
jgi:cytochrome b561